MLLIFSLKLGGYKVSTQNNYISTSLKRGLDILRLFNEENASLSLSEISQKLGVSRSVPYRLMYTLKEEGYVVQDSATKRYKLSPRVLNLGYSYINSFKLPELVHPYLEEIKNEINASCYLSVLDERHVVYVGAATVNELTGINVSIGTRLPSTVIANGKLLLSYQPQDKIQEILDKEELHRSPNERSFKSRKQLIEELRLIKEQGYAKGDQEYIDYISSVAVPIFDSSDQAVAAINAVVPNTSFDKNFLLKTALPKLLEVSEKINNYEKVN